MQLIQTAKISEKDKMKLLLLAYSPEQRKRVRNEIQYFYKKYAEYIKIPKNCLYAEINKLIMKKTSFSDLRYRIRMRLISEIQRSAIEKGDYALYTAFYSDDEKRVLGYLDRIEQIKKEMF